MEDNKTKIKKEKEEEKKESNFFATSLVFDKNITKIWVFIRDVKNEARIVDYLDNLRYINGKNTWIKGNVFSMDWIGLTPLKIQCVYSKQDRNKKIIKWKIKGDIGLYYYKAMYLYRISQNNKTVVKSIITINERDNDDYIDYRPSKNYYSNLEYNILKKKSQFLNSIKENIISYESCIVHQNFEKIWYNLNDLKKTYEIMGGKVEFKDQQLREGSFLKYYVESLNINIFLRVAETKIYKKKKYGLITLETIGVKYNKIVKRVEYKIIKINNNKTQFSIMHIFPPELNQDLLNKFQIYKKEIIKKYKQCFEENENDNLFNEK